MAGPKMTLADWLDDLTVRFILNLPPGELSSVPRLCFQVEEAQWFYEDFVRPAAAAEGDQLPPLNLRSFALALFQQCPLFSDFTPAQHLEAFEEFLAYKVRVPVRGAILLDEAMNHALLVRGWKKGSSWAFPRGKINKDEKDLDCAIREVYEETGYNIKAAGLVPDDEDSAKFIDVTMKGQHVRLYVFRGVPLNTYFEPRTRKEISKIQWYRVQNLPGFKKGKAQVHDTEGEAVNTNKFYMIAPFLGHLKKWIAQQRRTDKQQPNAAPEDEQEFEEDGALESEAIDLIDQLRNSNPRASLGQTLEAPAATPDVNPGVSLLAMLQGGSKSANAPIPQTPMDQINGVPHQPGTPQSRHPTDHGVGYPQAPPQFSYSPSHFQHVQLQQRPSLPGPVGFAQGNNGFSQQQSTGYHGQIPHHLRDQHRQSMQGPFPSTPRGPPLDMPFTNGPQNHPQPPVQPPRQYQSQHSHWTQRMQSEDFGAIGSGPTAPRASEVPMPHLSTQAMSLLDAFKSDKNGTNRTASANAAQQPTRAASTQQTALLDLFKKPAAAQAAPTPTADKPKSPVPGPPAASAVAETDSTMKQRRPSQINLITRTLPTPKVKSPPPQQPTATTRPQDEILETFKLTSTNGPLGGPRKTKKKQYTVHDGTGSRKIDALPAEPAETGKAVRNSESAAGLENKASEQAKKSGNINRGPKGEGLGKGPATETSHTKAAQPIQLAHDAPREPENNGVRKQLFNPSNPSTHVKSKAQEPPKPVVVAQRPAGQRQGQSPRARISGPARSPAMKPDHNGAAVPSFTILQRPGSASGKAVESKDVPLATNQPQILKRPMTPAEHKPSPLSLSTPSDEKKPAQPSGDNTDHLLALLGGGKASSTPANVPSVASPELPPAPQLEPVRSRSRQSGTDTNAQRNALLGLFNAPKASSPLTSPPPATAFPAKPAGPPQDRQNMLLDLFTKAPASSNSATATPISPFTLGTPVSRLPGNGLGDFGGRESRFNSVVSTGSGSRKGSGSGTPVSPAEQKDFLMGYLNTVIGKEGNVKK